MRSAVLTIALLFIAALTALTVTDLVRNGVGVVDALAILIIVLFLFGIVGALRHPPSE